MDYEKKYNEALERARKVHRNYKNLFPEDSYSEDIEEIFPELRESEDERILASIADCVGLMGEDGDVFSNHNVTKVQVLSWLEKQKINTEGDFGRGYDCGYQAGYAVAVNEMKPKVATATLDAEKQKELMPPVNIDPCDASCGAYYQRGLNKGYELGFEAGRKEQKPISQEDYDKAKHEALWGDQKPNSTEDMPYVADEHFFEREPADSFKYRLAEYMTKNCKKGEGPYGYSYNISSESILQMAKEELIKRGELKEQKPVEKQDYSGLNDLEREQDELEEETDLYLEENYDYNSEYDTLTPNDGFFFSPRHFRNLARHFAQWGAEHLKIDSEKPVPADFEEAAKAAATEVYTYTFQGMDDLIGLFKAGARWDRQQMLKDAVEGEVENASFGIVYLRKNLTNEGYLTGDKVRVIVLPNTDEK